MNNNDNIDSLNNVIPLKDKESSQEKKEDIDPNCEECEQLSLLATNIDHNPEKSIGVFLTAIEEGIASVSLTVEL